MKYSEMSNKEINKITFEKCPNKCCKCKSDCEDTAVGDCRKHLFENLDALIDICGTTWDEPGLIKKAITLSGK